MATRKSDRIPTPVYAAAGAGDLAYQKLRQLPGKVAETLPGRVADLRGRVAEMRPAVSEATLRADLDRLRAAARRNAATVVSGAHAAQQRAAVMYGNLVTHGEQVVRAAQAQRAAAPNGGAGADVLTATEVAAVEAEPTVVAPAPEPVAAETPAPEATPEAPAAKPAAKPAKRTRPTPKA